MLEILHKVTQEMNVDASNGNCSWNVGLLVMKLLRDFQFEKWQLGYLNIHNGDHTMLWVKTRNGPQQYSHH